MSVLPSARRSFAASALTSVLLLAGCGGEDSGSDPAVGTPGPRADTRATPTPTPVGPARGPALTQADVDREAVVLRRWADAMDRADFASAAGLFRLPTLVAPDPAQPPLRVATSAAARDFHRALPCGSRLVSTRPLGPYVVATFRLTERPGGDCGGGTGQLASVAFLMRGGRIAEWRRVPVPSDEAGPEAAPETRPERRRSPPPEAQSRRLSSTRGPGPPGPRRPAGPDAWRGRCRTARWQARGRR